MVLNNLSHAHIALLIVVIILAVALIALAKKSARFIAFLFSKRNNTPSIDDSLLIRNSPSTQNCESKTTYLKSVVASFVLYHPVISLALRKIIKHKRIQSIPLLPIAISLQQFFIGSIVLISITFGLVAIFISNQCEWAFYYSKSEICKDKQTPSIGSIELLALISVIALLLVFSWPLIALTKKYLRILAQSMKSLNGRKENYDIEEGLARIQSINQPDRNSNSKTQATFKDPSIKGASAFERNGMNTINEEYSISNSKQNCLQLNSVDSQQHLTINVTRQALISQGGITEATSNDQALMTLGNNYNTESKLNFNSKVNLQPDLCSIHEEVLDEKEYTHPVVLEDLRQVTNQGEVQLGVKPMLAIFCVSFLVLICAVCDFFFIFQMEEAALVIGLKVFGFSILFDLIVLRPLLIIICSSIGHIMMKIKQKNDGKTKNQAILSDEEFALLDDMYTKFEGSQFEEPLNFIAQDKQIEIKRNRAKDLGGPLETSLKENQSVQIHDGGAVSGSDTNSKKTGGRRSKINNELAPYGKSLTFQAEEMKEENELEESKIDPVMGQPRYTSGDEDLDQINADSPLKKPKNDQKLKDGQSPFIPAMETPLTIFPKQAANNLSLNRNSKTFAEGIKHATDIQRQQTCNVEKSSMIQTYQKHKEELPKTKTIMMRSSSSKEASTLKKQFFMEDLELVGDQALPQDPMQAESPKVADMKNSSPKKGKRDGSSPKKPPTNRKQYNLEPYEEDLVKSFKKKVDVPSLNLSSAKKGVKHLVKPGFAKTPFGTNGSNPMMIVNPTFDLSTKRDEVNNPSAETSVGKKKQSRYKLNNGNHFDKQVLSIIENLDAAESYAGALRQDQSSYDQISGNQSKRNNNESQAAVSTHRSTVIQDGSIVALGKGVRNSQLGGLNFYNMAIQKRPDEESFESHDAHESCDNQVPVLGEALDKNSFPIQAVSSQRSPLKLINKSLQDNRQVLPEVSKASDEDDYTDEARDDPEGTWSKLFNNQKKVVDNKSKSKPPIKSRKQQNTDLYTSDENGTKYGYKSQRPAMKRQDSKGDFLSTVQTQKARLKQYMGLAEGAKATSDVKVIKELLKELKDTKKPLPKARLSQFKHADWMFSAYKQKMELPQESTKKAYYRSQTKSRVTETSLQLMVKVSQIYGNNPRAASRDSARGKQTKSSLASETPQTIKPPKADGRRRKSQRFDLGSGQQSHQVKTKSGAQNIVLHSFSNCSGLYEGTEDEFNQYI